MSDSLYEEDFFAWTQTQARALKAYRADGGLDYGNLADEVGGLGRAQRATVFSMVRQILIHLYKLAGTQRCIRVLIGLRRSRTSALSWSRR